jgi:arylformamidase
MGSAVVALAVATAPVAVSADEPDCDGAPPVTTRNLEYVDEPVSPRQQLDVYGFDLPKGCPNVPVVVYVHGGGWSVGDKRRVGDKATFFNGLGYVFVSVNYRLSAPLADPERPMHPDHSNDVGGAIAWVEDHIAEHGGRGARIALLGHSAGAHLVALVGLDPTYVEDAGGREASIRCVMSNDTESYELVPRSDDVAGGALVRNAFGDDPETLEDASPMTHIGDRSELPDFLVVRRGLERRQSRQTAFAEALEAEGAAVTILDTPGLSHGDVNRLIGAPDDQVMTPAIERFTTACLG